MMKSTLASSPQDTLSPNTSSMCTHHSPNCSLLSLDLFLDMTATSISRISQSQFSHYLHMHFADSSRVYENVPYVAMRMVPATLGVLTVPLAYLTLRTLDCRATTALLASLFITFENGMITQSRHILLDSPLIFFTALTIFLWAGFCNEDKHEPFTESWWVWLALTGLSLGAVVSCKWVGLFTIATVGLGTIKQLWDLLGDLRVSPKLWMRHFMARALCLIVLPVLFYMWMFWLHFAILSNSGDGDGFMSSEFQHTLRGRGMQDTYAGMSSMTYSVKLLMSGRCRFWISDYNSSCQHAGRISSLAWSQLPWWKPTYVPT